MGARVSGGTVQRNGGRAADGARIHSCEDRERPQPGGPAELRFLAGALQGRPHSAGQNHYPGRQAFHHHRSHAGTFRFPGKTHVTPIAFIGQIFAIAARILSGVVARLKPDLSLAQAQGDMDKIAQQLQQEYPILTPAWASALCLCTKPSWARSVDPGAAAWSCGGAAAHRMCQHRQPVYRPRIHTRKRNGGQGRIRHNARAIGTPTSYGKPVVRSWRRCSGHRYRFAGSAHTSRP